MSKRIIWYFTIIISVVTLCLVASGLVNAMKFTIGSEKSSEARGESKAPNPLIENKKDTKSSPKDDKVINVMIMGDSIAKGTGDEKGKGLGVYLSDLLKNQTSKDIHVENAAVDGYKTMDLLSQIKSGKLNESIAVTDFIVISIGGNDLREILGFKDLQKEMAFKDKLDSYMIGFKEITAMIRGLNKDAQIVMIGLYIPAYLQEYSIEDANYLNTWSYNTQTILANDGKGIFVPTFDMFKNNLNRFVAADMLHPNAMGYQTIAYLISKSIETILDK